MSSSPGRRRWLRCQRGVSLIEIMIAVLVFAIVAVAIITFLHWARGHIVRMGLRRNALALAQQKVEELRTAWISDSTLAVGAHGPEPVPVSEHIVGSRTWSVALADDPANGFSGTDEDYKEVVVGVAWSWELTKHDSVSLHGRFYP